MEERRGSGTAVKMEDGERRLRESLASPKVKSSPDHDLDLGMESKPKGSVEEDAGSRGQGNAPEGAGPNTDDRQRSQGSDRPRSDHKKQRVEGTYHTEDSAETPVSMEETVEAPFDESVSLGDIGQDDTRPTNVSERDSESRKEDEDRQSLVMGGEVSLPTDSMVTVALSDSTNGSARVSTRGSCAENTRDAEMTSSGPESQQDESVTPSALSRASTPNANIADADSSIESGQEEAEKRADGSEGHMPSREEDAGSKRNSRGESENSGDSSAASVEVDWDELERTEEQEPRDEGSDESTAFLLARLEQENDALATDPKSALSRSQEESKMQRRRQSRPPSIHHLKKLVDEPSPQSLRYSLLPAPPPMTDLEFYAALVSDYHRTAQCLPTLLSKKVRNGIPPPLRGVVWMSMSGARDVALSEKYDSLCGESSPYENMIGKDIGRSFPGVDMFREADGEGQRRLAQVLKCFSLYDQQIGYCQGLGFVVGPLLMHMEARDAFCVLIRLMEHYDLRSCFLPDLCGLHMRIYQFKSLLTTHLPSIAQHLDNLQIESAYLSQWFLSFFGVTCPMPMLLRIYDVIFAEGAAETMMRVALAVMRRNEQKILESTEFEDVMHLLLSRELWDTYDNDGDEFVNDFTGLTGCVVREGLQTLENEFNKSKSEDPEIKLESPPDLQAVATGFLGRLWASSPASQKTGNLTAENNVPSRPLSFLTRTQSKQSVTSTLNSTEGTAEIGVTTPATELSGVSQDLFGESGSLKTTSQHSNLSLAVPSPSKGASKDRDLHTQIEDLLTALNEMQREQATLVAQLQREREERQEDHRMMETLVTKVKTTGEARQSAGEDDEIEKQDAEGSELDDEGSTRSLEYLSPGLSDAVDAAEDRLASLRGSRISIIHETKRELQDELRKARDRNTYEAKQTENAHRRIDEQDQEIKGLREELKDTRTRVRESHQEKQRLERTILDLQSRKSSLTSVESSCDTSAATSPVSTETPLPPSAGGLRELKLNQTSGLRSQTTPTFSKRTSSLNAAAFVLPRENTAGDEHQAVLAELVNSKTAEAVAKQEAEELKAKLESLKKMISGPSSAPAVSAGYKFPLKQPSLDRKVSFPSNETLAAPQEPPKVSITPSPPAASSSGGFWSSWGKRSVSSTAAT